MLIQSIKKCLYQVEMTEIEAETIYQYVLLNDFGIEINEGVNILEKDTLWFILCELNRIQFHTNATSNIVNQLKVCLYPLE